MPTRDSAENEIRGAPVVRNFAEPLLTVRDLADRLRVSTATVYALIERREIEHVRVSNAIRVAPEALAAYLTRPT